MNKYKCIKLWESIKYTKSRVFQTSRNQTLMFSPEGRRVRGVLGSLVSPRLPSAQTDPADLWDLALHQHPAGGSDITNTLTPQHVRNGWFHYTHMWTRLTRRTLAPDGPWRTLKKEKINEKKEKASKYNSMIFITKRASIFITAQW